MSGEELLQCYNRGCGEKYKQSENKEGRLCQFIYSRKIFNCKRNKILVVIILETQFFMMHTRVGLVAIKNV